MAQDKGKLEKKDVKIGFIPITCATPLIMSAPLGFYEKQGLNVTLVKTAGWALIRDKVMNKEYDASHLLAPMPLAMSLGVGSNAVPMNVATIQNSNGQAITLALKHKDKRDPKQWKGFKFAVPFEFSMHNFLLRYYVAEHGLDPDRDIQIRVVPPPEMVANLRADNIDGYLGPDPFNQRAVYDQVGFIHLLTKEIWDGHPCCSFGAALRLGEGEPEHVRRDVSRGAQRRRHGRGPGEPLDDRQRDRAGQLPQPAGAGARAGAHRQVRRRPGQREDGPQSHRVRSRAVERARRLDPHADEALGLPEGRRPATRTSSSRST